MSYCRWSSDHFECDVYVYANVSGMWTTHVAGRRLKHRVPDEIKAMFPEDGDPEWPEKYTAAYKAEQEWRDSLPCDERPCNYANGDGTTRRGVLKTPKASEYMDLREIGPEAGESYDDPTPGECADRLEALRTRGFNVPQYAIDALREDQEAMQGETEDRSASGG